MKDLIRKLEKKYNIEDIENTAIKCFIDNNNLGFIFSNELINHKIQNYNENCYKMIQKDLEIKDLEILNIFFEGLLTEKEKNENGIVFTPLYICDYIVKNTIKKFDSNTKIIDPSCGCGIFIISILNYLRKKTNAKIIDLLEKNIYGIDITKNNIERTKILLTLYCIMNGEDKNEIKFNIIEADSLFSDWNELFSVDKFDYIIGNPPYVNNHDLKEAYIKKLSSTFKTTTEGTFNIFYAFIEKSMEYLDDKGKLGYIIPNNFIHIQSARPLRQFIRENNYLNEIIDFKDNTIFYPILTYNCIMYLTKNNKTYKFAQIQKKEDFKSVFKNIEFKKAKLSDLSDNGWKLVDINVRNNISKIEGFNKKLDSYIRVGIATLRDKVYVIDGYDESNKMYYKIYNDKKYFIEEDITIPYIKVSKYKSDEDIGRIIFPYIVKDNNSIPIDVEILKKIYPMAYEYFVDTKETLDERDSDGKLNLSNWYMYGRSQGLNLWNEKILFSTFNENPNFVKSKVRDFLFSNGYCIINYDIDEDVLLKILNSNIMKYYIDNTSYSISGNYKCYQKKYVKNFSIPELSADDILFIKKCDDQNELDKFLISLYNLIFD